MTILLNMCSLLTFYQFVGQEQICKISSYESRVNKAKANYTKALQRLEELNSKIFDTSSDNLNTTEEEYLPFSEGSSNSQKCAGECCPEHLLPPNELAVTSEDSEVIKTTTTKTPTPSHTTTAATSNRSAKVFEGCQVLDELLLEDNIESTLQQLKSQCLS